MWRCYRPSVADTVRQRIAAAIALAFLLLGVGAWLAGDQAERPLGSGPAVQVNVSEEQRLAVQFHPVRNPDIRYEPAGTG